MTTTLQARFFDGRSAASIAVTVAVDPAGMQILDGPSELGQWTSWGDMRLVETENRRTDRIILRFGDHEDRRLIFDDGQEIKDYVELLSKDRFGHRKGLLVGAGFIGTVIVLVLALPLLGSLAAIVMPRSIEEHIGQVAYESVVDALDGQCSTAEGDAAIARLVRRLEETHPSVFPLTVEVHRSSVANAIALPAGHIIFFAPILQSLSSGEAFAFVLAHEKAHTDLRHSMAKMIESIGLTALIDISLGGLGGVSQDANDLISKSYSREDEDEADRLAIKMLQAAGISLTGGIDFFGRLAAQGPEIPTFLSTHPNSQDRSDLVAAFAADESGGPAMTQEDWEAIANICRRSE